MANVKLSPEVAEVIGRSTITGNILVLPPGQLDRPLYEAVNKALVAAGGKWKTRVGHVFTGDPRAKLGLMLETGVAVDEKKLFQAFYTPPALAARLVELANVSGCSVLEPSMGEGALVAECFAQGAQRVTGVELNPDAFKIACRKAPCAALLSDFLHVMPFDAMANFDRVVMNPPFTKDQDIQHVQHALTFLKPGGILVAVMGANIERARFKVLVAGLTHKIEHVEAGAFKAAGTNIPTIILRIHA